MGFVGWSNIYNEPWNLQIEDTFISEGMAKPLSFTGGVGGYILEDVPALQLHWDAGFRAQLKGLATEEGSTFTTGFYAGPQVRSEATLGIFQGWLDDVVPMDLGLYGALGAGAAIGDNSAAADYYNYAQQNSGADAYAQYGWWFEFHGTGGMQQGFFRFKATLGDSRKTSYVGQESDKSGYGNATAIIEVGTRRTSKKDPGI